MENQNEKFSEAFWTEKYLEENTGWDIGYIATPIKEYIDQLADKSLKILIPGAGNSYEGEYLWKNGFKHVFILDLSDQPLKAFKNRVPDFPQEQLLQGDFFELNQTFDLVIEQTFFCAIDPVMRGNYAKKMNDILQPAGKLVGLLFDFPLTDEGPPFGGCKEEYLTTFSPFFDIDILEPSYNSIKPRAGKEFFIKLQAKSK